MQCVGVALSLSGGKGMCVYLIQPTHFTHLPTHSFTHLHSLSKATAAQRRQQQQQQQQQGERQQALFEARVAAGVEAVLRRTTQLLPECDARQVG